MKLIDKYFKKHSITEESEELNSISISELCLILEYPGCKVKKILWSDIRKIRLINTDHGPYTPDVWLEITDSNDSFNIPMGTKGYDEVYGIISKFEGFNFENVIKSMTSTGNEEFDLWLKVDRNGMEK